MRGKAGDVFLAKGVGAALITLGEAGALLHAQGQSTHVPAFRAGPVVETTGAGDAFNGGFAAALARGARAGRGGPLRLRRRRHLGDARRHRAVDAEPRGGRGAAGEVIAPAERARYASLC